MTAFGWPDILIGTILVIGALRGFARGFVGALTGIGALAIGVFAAFHYGGGWDTFIAGLTHIGVGSAHVVAMWLYGIAAYAITVAAGVALARVAKLPGLGLINGIAGAGVGALEGAALVWLVLYVALFLDMPKDLRADLSRSPLVGAITSVNPRVDEAVRSMLPAYARPFVGGFLNQHRL